VRLVFSKFLELGTARQTLLWFLEHGLQLPVCNAGEELQWRRPSYATIYRMLTNPAYGGAYAYGKSEQATHYANGEPRLGQRRKPREQWLALIPNAHQGYVSWAEFERIREAISGNVQGHQQAGAANAGQALLAGILRCRRCGHKLTVRYTGNGHNVLRYSCWRGFLDNGQPRCIAFGGLSIDEGIAREILRVMQPAAIEAAVTASETKRASTMTWSRHLRGTWKRPAMAPAGHKSNSTRPIRRIAWSPMSSSDVGTKLSNACRSCNFNSSNTRVPRIQWRFLRRKNSKTLPQTWKRYGMLRQPICVSKSASFARSFEK
jgi:hypothetical protein